MAGRRDRSVVNDRLLWQSRFLDVPTLLAFSIAQIAPFISQQAMRG